jgi:hypothetical protein
MERNRVFSALGLALLASGCITGSPPASSATAPEPTASPAADAPAGASAPLVVWDGDQHANGKGWASCGKKDECTTSVEPAPNEGYSGAALKFKAEGSDWIGMGWNWHGWWPENAGSDISGHKELSFRIKVVAANAKEAPDPNSVNVTLACSANGSKDDTKKDADEAKVADFTTNLLDGEWHEVVVPLATFFSDKGKDFDKKSAWEFRIGTWSQDPRKFEILIDDITFR